MLEEDRGGMRTKGRNNHNNYATIVRPLEAPAPVSTIIPDDVERGRRGKGKKERGNHNNYNNLPQQVAVPEQVIHVLGREESPIEIVVEPEESFSHGDHRKGKGRSQNEDDSHSGAMELSNEYVRRWQAQQRALNRPPISRSG